MKGPIELIRESIKIFFKKENLVYFLKIYAILVVFAILSFVFDKYTAGFTNATSAEALAKNLESLPPFIIPVVTLAGLLYLIFSFWVSAAGIIAVSNVVWGTKMTIKEVFLSSWKKLWLFSLLSIIVGLIVGVGFILLIIPGIIFLVWFRFAGFEYLTKKVGILEALVKSKKLVSGKFWKVLGRIIVFGIFTILVQIVFGLIPFGLGGIIEPLFGALLILPYFLLYRELSR